MALKLKQIEGNKLHQTGQMQQDSLTKDTISNKKKIKFADQSI